MVCVTHFVAIFNPYFFYLWNTYPTKFVLEGVTGKLGVCILGVVMCYFAYKSRETNPIRYFLKRYFYFVVSGGVINAAYVLFGISNYSMGRTFIETMSLGSEIFPTFWCMRAFLLASFIAYLNGKFCFDNIYFLLIELVVLWCVGWYWTFICLLGCFVPILQNKEIISGLFGKPIVQLISLMTLFLLIKRDECVSTYVIDGISAVILLIVIENSRWLKFFLCRLKFSAMCGKYTMSIYLIHCLVFYTLGKWLFSIGSFESSYGNDFLFVMVLCMMTILPIAFVLQKLLDVCNLFVSRILVYLSK